ncbi:MAG: hypothetical protein LBR88_10575 [Zoogloeaceae bacterium]|nr:hypothetical protein [Zoogloeaceae bacterium]
MEKQNLSVLPPGSRRLLLSFTAQEWEQLTRDAQNMSRLERLHLVARARGVSLELLLGEPTWVLPKGRLRLMSLLRQIPGRFFVMAHLDLERHQLPADRQGNWETQVMKTLREAVAASPIPIALTTHHRELRPGFLRALNKAGVREIVPMIYVTNNNRVLEIVHGFPPLPKDMTLSVAQSVERDLPREESSFALGKNQSLAHWRALARQLRTIPNFKSIIIQSWEDYQSAIP